MLYRLEEASPVLEGSGHFVAPSAAAAATVMGQLPPSTNTAAIASPAKPAARPATGTLPSPWRGSTTESPAAASHCSYVYCYMSFNKRSYLSQATEAPRPPRSPLTLRP